MDTELTEETTEDWESPASAETVSAEPDPELLEGLRLLDNSQSLIRTIFLGLALQYRSLDLQRCLLKLQAEDPAAALCGLRPKEVQTVASLITLCALFGFQRQAEELACREAQAGGCPDLMDVKLGATIILISLIRLARLNAPVQSIAEQSGTPEEFVDLEETEELSEEPDF